MVHYLTSYNKELFIFFVMMLFKIIYYRRFLDIIRMYRNFFIIFAMVVIFCVIILKRKTSNFVYRIKKFNIFNILVLNMWINEFKIKIRTKQ